MASQYSDKPDLNISPLTFLQVYQSADTLMSALIEKDATFRHWFTAPQGWRQFGRYVIVPLYYHLMTSGYGVMVENRLVGWLYLRGWHQVVYIETLATDPIWRKRGVGTALLDFAEQQAHVLGREWLALTVTLENRAAVKLYEKQGYRRMHWHVMQHPGDLDLGGTGLSGVGLRLVFGPAAESAYRHYSELDRRAGDTWAAEAASRLSSYDPYRQLGREWQIEVDGQASGYLNVHQSGGYLVIYLACVPERWGTADILAAALHTIQPWERHLPIRVRLGSSGHHASARPVLMKMRFEEQPAITTRMFKQVPTG
jgi:ribosomal protein S18 acetylase RimI-like enzyme